MKPWPRLVLCIAAAGLASAGISSPPPAGAAILSEICGRPGMTIAIPLGGNPDRPVPDDCPRACHAVQCRFTDAAKAAPGGRGARI